MTHGAEHDSTTSWGSRYRSVDGALCIIRQGAIDISVGEGRNYSLAGDHTIPFLSLLDFLYQVINKLFVLVVSSQREGCCRTKANVSEKVGTACCSPIAQLTRFATSGSVGLIPAIWSAVASRPTRRRPVLKGCRTDAGAVSEHTALRCASLRYAHVGA